MQDTNDQGIATIDDHDLEQVSGAGKDGLMHTIGYYVGLAWSWDAYGWEQVG